MQGIRHLKIGLYRTSRWIIRYRCATVITRLAELVSQPCHYPRANPREILGIRTMQS